MEVICVKLINEYDKKYLELGKTYEVSQVIIHGWSTDVYLKGFEDCIGFNSCCFDDDFQKELDDAIEWFDEYPDEWGYDIFIKDYE